MRQHSRDVSDVDHLLPKQTSAGADDPFIGLARTPVKSV